MGWFDWFRRKPAPTPPPAPVPVPTPAPASGFPTQVFGVATEAFAEVAPFNTQAGKPVNVVSIYKSFFWDINFPTAEANKIAATGAIVMVTWEPWEPNGSAVQSQYALRTINAGNHDTLIKNWARQIKEYNKPVILRFAHEMNGDWYPWGFSVNGNVVGEYALAYQRVWLIFVAAGVTNVKWVWSPNVDFNLDEFYPGDRYVDFVALDGYNWDTSSPEEVFGSTIDGIKALTSRPIFIGETGCPEYSGKAKWITDFFVLLKTRKLAGFVWFNYKKEQDWRIESSNASLTAFRKGVSS